MYIKQLHNFKELKIRKFRLVYLNVVTNHMNTHACKHTHTTLVTSTSSAKHNHFSFQPGI